MEDENILIYVVGTAGSGKSTLTYIFQQWLLRNGYDAITVNLDPGAEKLNYEPDVDIREWLKLQDIMVEYQLGPNGAQIVCADMLAFRIQEVKEILDGFKSNYVIVDTPGQIELFAFRKASNVVVDTLGSDRAILAYLIDPFIGSIPNGFVSLCMLAATLQFRLNLPAINLISKVDLVEPANLNNMMEWSKDGDKLYSDCISESKNLSDNLNFELLKVMESMDIIKELVPVSAITEEGLAEIYTLCQQEFMASDDLQSE